MENINEHDMTKKMLDTIRNSNTPNTITENVKPIQSITPNTNRVLLDEHDMTKKMIGVINEFKDSSPSDIGTQEEDTIANTNDVIAVEDDAFGEEEEKIRSIVGSVELKLYEVYPKDRNVVMVGVLDVSGIEFKFSKNEGAPYINVDNMKLDPQTLEIIKRLEGYYEGWIDDWSKKIKEYIKSV